MPNFKQDRSKFTMKGWSPFTKATDRTGKAIEKSPRYKKLKVQTPQSLPTKEYVPQTQRGEGWKEYVPQTQRSAFTKKDEDKKKKNDKKQTSTAEAMGVATHEMTHELRKYRDNWVPAWPGADISEKERKAMTPKQKKEYQGE